MWFSDEHGIPITIRAKKEGVTPQDIVDKYHAIIKKSFEDLGISFDEYSRTSSENHKKTSQDFFLKMYETENSPKKFQNNIMMSKLANFWQTDTL